MNEVYNEFAVFYECSLDVVVAIEFQYLAWYKYMLFSFIKEHLYFTFYNCKNDISFRVVMFFHLFTSFAAFFYDYIVRALE